MCHLRSTAETRKLHVRKRPFSDPESYVTKFETYTKKKDVWQAGDGMVRGFGQPCRTPGCIKQASFGPGDGLEGQKLALTVLYVPSSLNSGYQEATLELQEDSVMLISACEPCRKRKRPLSCELCRKRKRPLLCDPRPKPESALLCEPNRERRHALCVNPASKGGGCAPRHALFTWRWNCYEMFV